MIDALRQKYGFSVEVLCRTLGMSRSGYHVWQRREPTARQKKEGRFEVGVQTAHERGRGAYGTEKNRRKLAEVDRIKVGVHRIKRSAQARPALPAEVKV